MRRTATITVAAMLAAACAGGSTSGGSTTTAPAGTTTTTAAVTTTAASTTTTLSTGPVDVALLQPVPEMVIPYGDGTEPMPYTLSIFTGSPLKAAIGAPLGFPDGSCLGLSLRRPEYQFFFNGYLPIGDQGDCSGYEGQEGVTPIAPEDVLAMTADTIIVQFPDAPVEAFIPEFQVELHIDAGWYSQYTGDPIEPDGAQSVEGKDVVAVPGGGLFRAMTYEPLLLPPITGSGSCVPDDQTLCLGGDKRFKVTVTWSAPSSSPTGTGGGAGMVADVDTDTGTFWFFDQENWDLIVKVVDGCGTNGHFWVFAASTTDVEYELHVIDTTSDTPYTAPAGMTAPAIIDTQAFATCP